MKITIESETQRGTKFKLDYYTSNTHAIRSFAKKDGVIQPGRVVPLKCQSRDDLFQIVHKMESGESVRDLINY